MENETKGRRWIERLAIAFVIGIVLVASHTLVFLWTANWATQNAIEYERERHRYVTVYGRITEYFTGEPITNVTIVFFVGDSNEIPYTKATYSTSTDENGYYVKMMPIYSYGPEIIAVKDGYYATIHYLKEIRPQPIMWYGKPYWSAIYHANFTMIEVEMDV